jgi:N-acetylglucosamine-6-phosphate deacetylase
LEIAGGLIKVITVAPEVPMVLELIKHATSHGVVCAIGHTNANREQIEEAIKAGASVSTHIGNGSKSVIDRLNNNIWIQLAEDRLKASIIADLVHVPKSALKVFARAKGSERIILVSDISPVAGIGTGKMKWGDISVEVNEDTSIRLSGTPYLAGASSSLLKNVINFHLHTETSLADSIAMATTHPSQHYSLDMNRLRFIPGNSAECILFNYDHQEGTVNLERIVSPYKY